MYLEPVDEDIYENDELRHWGIIGMKWGIRRYQNEDGSLTEEGKQRYRKNLQKSTDRENRTGAILDRANKQFTKVELPKINSKYEGKNLLEDPKLMDKYNKEIYSKADEIYEKMLKEEFSDIANQVYDDEAEWLSQFDFYNYYTNLLHSDIYDNELKHYGTLGMRWGIRRYQNPDGSLTPEGRIRYGVGTAKETQRISYSERYNYLKGKKDKTEKEKKEFEDLDIGKKVLEKQMSNTKQFDKDLEKMPKAVQDEVIRYAADYLESTNYGKGMKFAGTMSAIPAGALGFAVDGGLLYAEMQAHLPIVAIPGLTLIGAGLGSALGSTSYASKHLDEFQKDYEDINGKTTYTTNTKVLDKYLKDDANQIKKVYGKDAIAYDQYNGNIARVHGPDYSEKDKEIADWQKERIKEFVKEAYK